jgi:hypothetical protein
VASGGWQLDRLPHTTIGTQRIGASDMTSTDINTNDLIKTLHYCERYDDGDPALQRIRVEVDTALYTLYREHLRLAHTLAARWESVHYAAGDKRRYVYVGNRTTQRWSFAHEDALAIAQQRTEQTDNAYVASRAAEALQDLAEAQNALEANEVAQRPLREAYSLRPWTRAFLVTDGHVHSSMECSTCFPTTAFTWLTQFSDHDEAEIVEAAGERACTVCYPSAPTLRSFEKASALFTEEEAERNAAREQRAAEKAARNAKKIEKALNPDGSEFVIRVDGWTEHFKTETAAVQWAVRTMADGYAHQQTQEYIDARNAIFEAVARKHNKPVEQVRQEIDAKVQAKIKRDRSY